ISLEKMAHGGVYDQLAGGFHRYSVDERWIVPHFEKMCYDNSELLKNYVHAYQATGSEFFAEIARDIIRWMDEWLSDREHGGFYASQDADYSMDDDGDYFTWTVQEMKSVLTEEEAEVASLRYDINEIGEMHHNAAKNVLYIRAPLEEISKRLNVPLGTVRARLQSAKQKMYAARLKRPTPYIDKTVYVSWNALCISAYLEAAKVLGLDAARQFALRSLDRILAEGWNPEGSLLHVIAYSDSQAERRRISGLLDDYAFTACACLDAYEATSDLSYFDFAHKIADAMIRRFFDSVSGGFFDTQTAANGNSDSLGVLGTRRKPFQDSPTPAGNPVAAIALLRMHAYTNELSYREKAERTLEILADVAGQYGLFAATYGIAAVHFSQPHTQVIVVGSGEPADQLFASAVASFDLNKAALKFESNQIAPQNLPPALAETVPHLPGIEKGTASAIICSGFSCQPPISDPKELTESLRRRTGSVERQKNRADPNGQPKNSE
ncbi:MAG TPA: sigma factor-like helix-turn-helix DNA-binding protein, partial [Terriglobales bacterium]|nr:sigma factor-like helix-turn-helix DNA-binding protein [Terriglobales bacterium]